ncbi:MAG: hypothetical protein WC314_19890 [Vulcanimicrobiota bacterium]
MKKLMYIPAAGEGPEQKHLGAPFNFSVTPNEVFEAADNLAALLCEIPQIREVVVAPSGAVKPKAKKGRCKK